MPPIRFPPTADKGPWVRPGVSHDLYLMRHGETEWNVDGRLQGRRDSPLTPRGMAQARWLADLTRDIAGVRLASPLGRADQTARLVFGAGYHHDPRLVEICVGRFAGQHQADLQHRYPEIFAGGGLDWYDRCPDGEGLATLKGRCRSFLGDICGPTLVITHGITLRMLRLLAMNRPDASFSTGEVRQGAVHLVRHGVETVIRHPDDR